MGRARLSPKEANEVEALVLRDLRALRDLDSSSADEHELREASVRMRRLCIDGLLGRYRQIQGLKGEARILTPAQPPFTVQPVFWTAAGQSRGGPSTLERIRTGNPPGFITMPFYTERPMSAWLKAPCMLLHGQTITRADVLKYVANKLGGIHLDASRNSRSGRSYLAAAARTSRSMPCDSR